MIAALYVAPGGVYYGLDDVDPWPESRDARTYVGPWPVVAHPPCARWGRYWFGGPSCRERKVKGDDGGCFAAALEAVRAYGGVLEHPEVSAAFATFGLRRPDREVGWQPAGDWIGWVCCVEQGHYGHRARKATWLYAVASTLPALTWGASHQGGGGVRLDAGFHSAEERKLFRATLRAFRSNRTFDPEMKIAKNGYLDAMEAATGCKLFERLGKRERNATPIAFRDVLLNIARSCVSRSTVA